MVDNSGKRRHFFEELLQQDILEVVDRNETESEAVSSSLSDAIPNKTSDQQHGLYQNQHLRQNQPQPQHEQDQRHPHSQRKDQEQQKAEEELLQQLQKLQEAQQQQRGQLGQLELLQQQPRPRPHENEEHEEQADQEEGENQPGLQQESHQKKLMQESQPEEDPGEVSSTSFTYVEAKANAVSERKRSREKQRRCDINMQFVNLTQLLKVINEEENNESENSEELKLILAAFKPSNQAHLLAHTTSLMARLHDSNKRYKTEVDRLERELQEVKKKREENAKRSERATDSLGKMIAPVMSTDGCTSMMVPRFIQESFYSMPPQVATNLSGQAFETSRTTQPMTFPYPTLTPYVMVEEESINVLSSSAMATRPAVTTLTAPPATSFTMMPFPSIP